MNRYLYCLFVVLLLSESGSSKSDSNIRKEIERFESVTLPNTQIRKLASRFNGQNYRIYVNIPASYFEEPQKKYPALLTLTVISQSAPHYGMTTKAFLVCGKNRLNSAPT